MQPFEGEWDEPGPMGTGETPGGAAAVADAPPSCSWCKELPAEEASTVRAADAELVKRNKKLSALVALAETISHSLDLQTVLNDALDKVIEIAGMQYGEIYILDLETERLMPRASRGASMPKMPAGLSFSIGEGVPGLVAEAAKALVIHNVLEDPRFVRGKNGWPAPHALVGIPLMARGQVVGVMSLFCLRPCPHHRRPTRCSQCPSLSPEEVSLLVAMGQQIGMAVENARLWEELKRKEKNRAYLLKQVIAAQEEERKRIARELHDGAGQSITSLMIGLKRLQSSETPEEARRLAGELRTTAARTLDEIHDLALELRPSMLDDMGLWVTLQRYCAEYSRRTGIVVDYHQDGPANLRLPGSVEIAVYRVVQEALTNVVKHASAGNVSVLVRCTGGRLRAIIEDDGVGFDVAATLEDAPDERKLGLVGMQERANLLGGTCTFESRPGAGCTVFVEVPIPLEGVTYEREDTAAACR